MRPAIYCDAFDIACRIETTIFQHSSKLFANVSFEGLERRFLGEKAETDERRRFRKDTQKEYTSKTLTQEMIVEGKSLAQIADNVCVKLPLTWGGITACKALSGEGIKTNVTLCFSANQALLAAKAGATYISPFIGRLDDINIDGMDLIREIRVIYDNYDFRTEILAASIRSANHVKDSALCGADVATVPPGVLKGLAAHPLTDKGLKAFLDDWAKTGQKII